MAQPIIKWMGGKRRLIEEIKRYIPKEYNDYYEPFFGGGALFFNLELKNKKAVINDYNKDLVNLYIQIRDNKEKFLEKLLPNIDNLYTQDYYLKIRDEFNEKIKKNEYDLDLAVLLMLLNQSCFNGVYRKNKNNEFNTPYGLTFKNKNSINKKILKEKISKASELLNRDVSIYSKDYKEILKMSKKGDFVFLDPPYIDTENRYSDTAFTEKDQEDLSNLCRELDNKGVYFLATNLNTEFIREIYKGFNFYTVDINYTTGQQGHVKKQEIFISNCKRREDFNLFSLR